MTTDLSSTENLLLSNALSLNELSESITQNDADKTKEIIVNLKTDPSVDMKLVADKVAPAIAQMQLMAGSGKSAQEMISGVLGSIEFLPEPGSKPMPEEVKLEFGNIMTALSDAKGVDGLKGAVNNLPVGKVADLMKRMFPQLLDFIQNLDASAHAIPEIVAALKSLQDEPLLLAIVPNITDKSMKFISQSQLDALILLVKPKLSGNQTPIQLSKMIMDNWNLSLIASYDEDEIIHNENVPVD